MNSPLISISVECMLSFMEYLTLNKVSVYMVNNYVSAVKAMALIYGMEVKAMDDRLNIS